MPLLTEEELVRQRSNAVKPFLWDEEPTPQSLEAMLNWFYTMYHLPSATRKDKKQWLYHMRELYSLKSRLPSE
jgi:hypothetical protein